MKKILGVALFTTLLALGAYAKTLPSRSADPYLGAIVVNAATGDALFENQADAQGYPASCIKLMDLLVILEKIEQGSLKFDDFITVTAEASTMGGSQAYLKEKEAFKVDDLLYALMVQSANDAAVALAIHVGGTKDGFTELMNEKAKALGMTNTQFHSVHGLPPGAGQEPDVSTPRDLSLLCRELLKHKDALRYTSTKERPFRPDAKEPFIMGNHNPLLTSFDGCDGFKTGYFTKAGFSIAATAQRKDGRVIAIILGSVSKDKRNAQTKELLLKGFLELEKRSMEKSKPSASTAVKTP
jgi:serine-type D-Ala-D-Ala carboxypeptidase (penicillin-binding protein 5/6)